jgi:mono/diheme cytochrome c family protein
MKPDSPPDLAQLLVCYNESSVDNGSSRVIARTSLGVLVAVTILALCLGCGGGGTPPSPEPDISAVPSTNTGEPDEDSTSKTPSWDDARQLSSGRQVYLDSCMRCHGDRGLGDGPDAASLYKPPADLAEHVPHHSDEHLAELVRGGRSPMPGFRGLSDQQLEDLLAYLLTLAGSAESGHAH